ncbi:MULTISPECIES: hypothetical protein [unclassified Azospirillum]|uniref:oxidoreductase n=1 Tax=unclassified Azospirillum TaxID=2630922 RepID=UPI000B63E795|nr:MULTISPECIES: hypothetical protein [unclassified Azospirillum]SNS30179.1 2,4-dienoyl-CoA reductase [Azospirillum sp. RU38E]SNS48618.1 2,4-dienoyl-CoA reductase [Azospirillum sp. RU37A]
MPHSSQPSPTDIPLNSPVRLGSLRLPSRVVMGPGLQGQAGAGHVPSLAMLEQYAALAPRAGLLLTEPAHVVPDPTLHPGTPGLYSPEQAVAWRGISDTVHQADGRLAARLYHADCWRIAQDGEKLADLFGIAANRARQAGFDAVEIDALGLTAGPHGLAGRLGLIVDAVAEVMGSARTGVRLGLGGACARGRPAMAEVRLAEALDLLEKAGIGFLHLQVGWAPDEAVALARALYRGKLIVNAGAAGCSLVAEGLADAVLLASGLASSTPAPLPASAAA